MPLGLNRVADCEEEEDGKPATGGERGGGRSPLKLLGVVVTLLSVLFILLTFPITAWACAKVIKEYERCVVFRMGRIVKGQAKGPGLFWIIPWLDVLQKVDLRAISFQIPPQEVLTADGVSLQVGAVMFYRVVDPIRWVMRVSNGYQATHTLAQTTVRATLGAYTLAGILTLRKEISERMEEVLDSSSRRWGVKVERVEIKDLILHRRLLRCMAAQAEADREARAKMILAQGEVEASRALKEASCGLSSVALQLRYLQSLSAVSSQAAITVLPLPQEHLDTFLCPRM